LENILVKNVDMTQIKDLYNMINIATNELEKLGKEKELLKKIKEEQNSRVKKQQDAIKEMTGKNRISKFVQNRKVFL